MHEESARLPDRWREKAELFRQHGHEATARTYEVCSAELEAAVHADQERALDLKEAAAESGYSIDHLGRLVREGAIPNAGRRSAPRIRRRDLPRRVDRPNSVPDDGPLRASPTGTSDGNSVSFERIARGALVSKRR